MWNNNYLFIVLFLFKGVYSIVGYRELIGKIERFNKYFCITMCASLAVCLIPPPLYTIISYYMFNKGEESFHLYSPSWFVFIRKYKKRIKSYVYLPQKWLNRVFAVFVLFNWKVSIWLENTHWICVCTFGSGFWKLLWSKYIYAISKSFLWIMLALHFHCWWHQKGFNHFQCHRQITQLKSWWINETLL